MKKLISNQISPHFSYLDSLYALGQIRSLWKDEFIDFEPYFKTPHYQMTNAARTALSKIIDIVKPPKNKKIGIPAFCCAVMATPFLEKGYEIEWIDTDENGVIDVEDFQKKSNEIGLVLVPHIFGQKAPVAQIRTLAREKKIFLVEDGAHLLDPDTEYCDAKILSFGREKVVSCVSGGALLWPENSPFAEAFSSSLLAPQKTDVLRHLLYPTIYALALPIWYTAHLGKALAYLMGKLKILPRAVTTLEKKGYEDFPQRSLAPALQKVLRKQLQKYEKRIHHYKKIAQMWEKVLKDLFPDAQIIIPDNYFRVLLKTPEAQEIKKIAKSWGYDLSEWEGNPISPKGVAYEKFGYQKGDCRYAEDFSQNYVTFPTHIRIKESDVDRFKTLWKLIIHES